MPNVLRPNGLFQRNISSTRNHTWRAATSPTITFAAICMEFGSSRLRRLEPECSVPNTDVGTEQLRAEGPSFREGADRLAHLSAPGLGDGADPAGGRRGVVDG